MCNISKLIREDLQHFSGYLSARKEATKGEIWLNANESPWEENTLVEFEDLNRYPQQQPDTLLTLLSNFYQVDPAQLVMTRGSNEAIDILIRLFCTAGKDAIITFSPTFDMYKICAELQNVRVIDVPLINFQLNLEKIASHLTNNIKLIFICSPNNPTGNIINPLDIAYLCKITKHKCLVIIDEAYIEYANSESLSHIIKNTENLVILRTLSKALGLAAVRIGCLIANSNITESVRKVLPPYPLPQPCIDIAAKKFSDDQMHVVKERIKIIKTQRGLLQNALESISIVNTVWPSETNFLLVQFKLDLSNQLEHYGIVIRDMKSKLNKKYIYRISIGKPEENNKLLKILKIIENQNEKK